MSKIILITGASSGFGKAIAEKFAAGVQKTGRADISIYFLPERTAEGVALIELDEGFRMMSRVEGVLPEQVFIGMRVQVEIVLPESGNSIPVFKSL